MSPNDAITPSQPLWCPKCDSKELGALVPSDCAYTNQQRHEPATIECLSCKEQFQATPSVLAAAQKLAPTAALAFRNDEDAFLYSFRNGKQFGTDNFDAVVTLAQLLTVSHDPTHRKTCFKIKAAYSRTAANAECRFGFPKLTRLLEQYREQDKLSDNPLTVGVAGDSGCHRGIGSAYINSHSPAMLSVFGCNNDVKFLTDPGVIYYMTRYPFKGQSEMRLRSGEQKLISQAFRNRQNREKQRQHSSHRVGSGEEVVERDERIHVGRGHALFLTHFATEKVQTALTLACQYLFRVPSKRRPPFMFHKSWVC